MQSLAREIARELPSNTFKPYTGRLVHIFTLFALGGLSLYALVELSLPWYAKLGLSLVVGHCGAISGLLAHEVLHGAVVRNQKLQNVLGFMGLLPFLISPTFWRYWHNKLHHSFTQKLIQDPDAYPTLRIFKHSKFMKWMFPFSPGSGHKRSYLYFFFWFSFNVQMAQFYFRFRNRIFEKMDHKRVNLELLLMTLPMIGLALWSGPAQWLWVFAIPFVVQNYIVFSYISTNHNLNPLTPHNDTLENSLTVTNNPILEFIHVNFGYHVEHHLFPNMNAVHAKKVHKVLLDKYPEQYKIMPKWQAIRALYKTARIYKSNKLLINPETGVTYETLRSPEPPTTEASELAPSVQSSSSKTVEL